MPITYDITAKPTLYRGTTFRSRLEATWAAMFDLLDWRWSYEGDPIGRWLPDFRIAAARAPGGMLLAEVKPVFDFPKEVAHKLYQECKDHECLLLGLRPFDLGVGDFNPEIGDVDSTAYAAIGWLRRPDPICKGSDGGPFLAWRHAQVCKTPGYGVTQENGRCENRMLLAGVGHSPSCSCYVPLEEIECLWGKAEQSVRYSP
jgi:hypothetical protein